MDQAAILRMIDEAYRAQLNMAFYAASGVAIPNVNPGNTNENILAAVTIPGGLMGLNGLIEIISLWSMTNSANNKTPRIRLGGIAGTVFHAPIFTTIATYQAYCAIRNRGAVNSQVSHAAAAGTLFGTSASAVTTGAINMAVNQDLVFTAQLALGSETLGLESYAIKIWK